MKWDTNLYNNSCRSLFYAFGAILALNLGYYFTISTEVELKCDVANHATQRAASDFCRKKIQRKAKEMKEGFLGPQHLRSKCHLDDETKFGAYDGCYSTGNRRTPMRIYKTNQLFAKFSTNFPKSCVDYCLLIGFQIAGIRFKEECLCGNLNHLENLQKLPDERCEDYLCTNSSRPCGGFVAIAVYFTGLGEMLDIERKLKTMGNFEIMKNRHNVTWGGEDVLLLNLRVIREYKHWHWDYVINLSENDFPVQSQDAFESILLKHNGHSFMKSVQSFRQGSHEFISKQGINNVFVDCDAYWFKLGQRDYFPKGITVDGGSDWFVLHRDFALYAALSNDQVPSELRKLWRNIFIPAESFFQTVLYNSEFCASNANTNLRHNSWKHGGRHCCVRNTEVADWCGCSPPIFLDADWPLLKQATERQIFFARKFDPFIDPAPIELAESQALGPRAPDPIHWSFYSHWLNVFHYSDVNKNGAILSFLKTIGIVVNEKLVGKCVAKNALQLNILKRRNNIQLVAQYGIECDKQDSKIEVLIKRKNRDTKLDEKVMDFPFHLNFADIGTQFDIVDRVLRNFAGIISADDTPSLSAIWTHKENYTFFKHMDLWIPAATGLVEEMSLNTMDIANPMPQQSIYPGISLKYQGEWIFMSYLLPNETLLYSTSFLVFPSNGKRLENMDLLRDYFTILDICESCGVRCLHNLADCKKTNWSSEFPDPKSDILTSYDYTLGMLV